MRRVTVLWQTMQGQPNLVPCTMLPGPLRILSLVHPCLPPLWSTLMFLRTEPVDVISLTVSASCLTPVRQDCRTEVLPSEAEMG